MLPGQKKVAASPGEYPHPLDHLSIASNVQSPRLPDSSTNSPTVTRLQNTPAAQNKTDKWEKVEITANIMEIINNVLGIANALAQS